MRVLVKYLKGKLKGRLDIWSYGSALTAERNGVVEIVKKVDNKLDVVIK